LEISNDIIANDNKNNIEYHLDNTDFKIISLMVLGQDNKEVSSTLKIPLSTIQRRTRRILQSGMVKVEYQPNFKLLDIAKGLLHTYLRDGQLRQTAKKISEMEGILSVSIHVGNSDIVSEFVYDNSEDLVDIMGAIKQIEGVERVLWSEEVFKLPSHKENIMKSFQKYWQNNNNNNKHNNSKYQNNKDNNNIKKNNSNGGSKKK
jgi:DNA-binding Lrp family transcriptional regulator